MTRQHLQAWDVSFKMRSSSGVEEGSKDPRAIVEGKSGLCCLWWSARSKHQFLTPGFIFGTVPGEGEARGCMGT